MAHQDDMCALTVPGQYDPAKMIGMHLSQGHILALSGLFVPIGPTAELWEDGCGVTQIHPLYLTHIISLLSMLFTYM